MSSSSTQRKSRRGSKSVNETSKGRCNESDKGEKGKSKKVLRGGIIRIPIPKSSNPKVPPVGSSVQSSLDDVFCRNPSVAEPTPGVDVPMRQYRVGGGSGVMHSAGLKSIYRDGEAPEGQVSGLDGSRCGVSSDVLEKKRIVSDITKISQATCTLVQFIENLCSLLPPPDSTDVLEAAARIRNSTVNAICTAGFAEHAPVEVLLMYKEVCDYCRRAINRGARNMAMGVPQGRVALACSLSGAPRQWHPTAELWKVHRKMLECYVCYLRWNTALTRRKDRPAWEVVAASRLIIAEVLCTLRGALDACSVEMRTIVAEHSERLRAAAERGDAGGLQKGEVDSLRESIQIGRTALGDISKHRCSLARYEVSPDDQMSCYLEQRELAVDNYKEGTLIYRGHHRAWLALANLYKACGPNGPVPAVGAAKYENTLNLLYALVRAMSAAQTPYEDGHEPLLRIFARVMEPGTDAVGAENPGAIAFFGAMQHFDMFVQHFVVAAGVAYTRCGADRFDLHLEVSRRHLAAAVQFALREPCGAFSNMLQGVLTQSCVTIACLIHCVLVNGQYDGTVTDSTGQEKAEASLHKLALTPGLLDLCRLMVGCVVQSVLNASTLSQYDSEEVPRQTVSGLSVGVSELRASVVANEKAARFSISLPMIHVFLLWLSANEKLHPLLCIAMDKYPSSAACPNWEQLQDSLAGYSRELSCLVTDDSATPAILSEEDMVRGCAPFVAPKSYEATGASTCSSLSAEERVEECLPGIPDERCVCARAQRCWALIASLQRKAVLLVLRCTNKPGDKVTSWYAFDSLSRAPVTWTYDEGVGDQASVIRVLMFSVKNENEDSARALRYYQPQSRGKASGKHSAAVVAAEFSTLQSPHSETDAAEVENSESIVPADCSIDIDEDDWTHAVAAVPESVTTLDTKLAVEGSAINHDSIQNSPTLVVRANPSVMSPKGTATRSALDIPLIIIDAPNIAMRYGMTKSFACNGIAIAIEFFQRLGHKVIGFLPVGLCLATLYFYPSHAYNFLISLL